MSRTVAITTMHAVFNYGSILQTYALYQYIKELGYEPFIVDYVFPNDYHLSLFKKPKEEPKVNKWRAHLNGICHRILKLDISRKKRSLEDFMNKMKLSEKFKSEEELLLNPPLADIYVTGSDQVWNPYYIGNDNTFFLHWVPNVKKNNKISYGPSFGGGAISSDFINRITPLLQEYKAISVRERPQVLNRLNIPATQVLDPVFLLSKQQWKDIISDDPIVKGKYILCYLLGYSFNPFPYAYDVIKEIKKQTGFKVVMIGGEPLNILKGYQLFNDCGPEEFLNLFYYSSFVITSSFHGTAFAINFNKPFISIVDDKKVEDERQKNIIRQVGLGEDYILPKKTPVHGIKVSKLGVKVAPNLEEFRGESIQYLENSLKLYDEYEKED